VGPRSSTGPSHAATVGHRGASSGTGVSFAQKHVELIRPGSPEHLGHGERPAFHCEQYIKPTSPAQIRDARDRLHTRRGSDMS
jgi:hypothetical protein